MGQLVIGKNDLLTRNPELAKEFHPTKNGNLKPSEVAEYSNKKVWWFLPYDDPVTGKHFDFEWEATPNSRSSGIGCPFLSNKKLYPGFNDLQTRNPDLAKEWHPTKNGNLTPKDVLSACNKRVWWYYPYNDPHTGKHFDFEWEATVNNRNKGSRCPYITGRSAWKDYNDMWTTNPEVASLLYNADEGYRYMINTDKKLAFVCPNCGNIVIKKPRRVMNENGYFVCPRCGDGFSFPEKFVYNVLEQLGESFIYQLSNVNYKWCLKYKYDFYVTSIDGIIEVNGRQHYEDTSRTKLKEVQKNDLDKKELALQNGIANYIYINAYYSSSEWLINSVKQSLGQIFNLESIDWNRCIKNAYKSNMVQICREWDDDSSLIYEIAERYHISEDCVKLYLKNGAEIGLCTFDSEKYHERVKKDGTSRRWQHQVICLETNKVFPSVRSAAIFYDCNEKAMQNDCYRKKIYSCGKNHFMYYDNYIDGKNEDIIKKYVSQQVNISTRLR